MQLAKFYLNIGLYILGKKTGTCNYQAKYQS